MKCEECDGRMKTIHKCDGYYVFWCINCGTIYTWNHIARATSKLVPSERGNDE